jgi:hypothetical protein
VISAQRLRPASRASAQLTPPDQDVERMFKKPISTADHHNP